MIGEGIAAANGDKPSGEFSADMTGPGAWPETDESVFAEREAALRSTKSALETAMNEWESNQAGIFNGVLVWSGVSAGAAREFVDGVTQKMKDHRTQLEKSITSCETAAGAIKGAKGTIWTAVEDAQNRITTVRNNAAEDDADPTAAIYEIVNETFSANVKTVDNAAVSLGGQPGPPRTVPFPAEDTESGTENRPLSEGSERIVSASLITSDDGRTTALAASLPGNGSASPIESAPNDQLRTEVVGSSTPAAVTPAEASPGTPSGGVVAEDGRTAAADTTAATPQPVIPPQASATQGQPAQTAQRPNITVANSQDGSGAPTGPASLSGTTGSQATGGDSSGGPWSNAGSGSESASTEASATNASQASHTPTNPVEAFMQGYAEGEPSMNPASAGSSPTAQVAQTAPVAPDSTNTSTQAAGHNPSANQPSNVAPVGQSATAAPLNAGSPVTGGGMGGMPLAPPPTVSPAAPPPMAPPPVAPASAPPAAAAAAAPIPVSTARRERDAIAAVSRRGSDPSQVATRIAAALNAIPTQDFGFYWVTALTVDGTIVVANSYGIGYIPEGVNLPDQVKMASADESIPAVDRGKWATYPMLTLKGWAEQHSTTLRMVIATESQFQGFDPGAAKMILQPDDIPGNGQMQGRSRLEVIAPQAAAQLAAVSDADLPELLPVAPADGTPPADETFQKWFNVMKPMMSQSDERGQFHLKAFIEYANYSQEKALHSAHTAADATTLRAAIADWIYWQHLGVLTSDALSELQPS